MPLYLTRAKYTPETWKRMIANPEDRRVASKEGEEIYGGKFLGMWYSLGEWDVYAMAEAPDNESVAMLMTRIFSSGGFSAMETTVLLTVDEMLAALRRAQAFEYAPPGTEQTDES